MRHAHGQQAPESTGASTTAQVPSPRPPTVSVKTSKDHLLKQVDAPYPPIAAAAHVVGTVVVGAEIDAIGNVREVVVLSGPEMLRAAAVDAVKQYKYRPFEVDGKPAAVRTAVQVEFRSGRAKSG